MLRHMLATVQWLFAFWLHVYRSVAEWWVDTVLGTWEESIKTVVRESFAQLTRFLNGLSAWVVSLFDNSYYQSLRKSWKQQHAWQTWWGEDRQSTFNAVIERVHDAGTGASPGSKPHSSRTRTTGDAPASCSTPQSQSPPLQSPPTSDGETLSDTPAEAPAVATGATPTITAPRRRWRLGFQRAPPPPSPPPVPKPAMRRSPSDLFDRHAGQGISEGLRRTSLMEDLRWHVEATVTRAFAAVRSCVRTLFLLPHPHPQWPTPSPRHRASRKSSSRGNKASTATASPRAPTLSRRRTPSGGSSGNHQQLGQAAATPLRRTLSLGRWEHVAGHAPGPLAEVSSAADFIRTAGYPLEVYQVVTDDGYVLQMERIPRAGAKDTVFFMHGVLDTSLGWVSAGVTGSLAFAAWDQGFDVWLGNTRCNPPRRHQERQGAAYWMYTNNELALYDVAALLDHIHTTKCAELGAGAVHLDLRHLGPLASSYLRSPQPSDPPAPGTAAHAAMLQHLQPGLRLSSSDTSLNRLTAKPLDSFPILAPDIPESSSATSPPNAATAPAGPIPSSPFSLPTVQSSIHPLTPPTGTTAVLHAAPTPTPPVPHSPPILQTHGSFHLTAQTATFPLDHPPTTSPLSSAHLPSTNIPSAKPPANPGLPATSTWPPPIRTPSDPSPLDLPATPTTPPSSRERHPTPATPPSTTPSPRPPATPHRLQLLGHGAPASLNAIPYSKLAPSQVTSFPVDPLLLLDPDSSDDPTSSPERTPRRARTPLLTPTPPPPAPDEDSAFDAGSSSVVAAASRFAATTAAVAAAGVVGAAAAAGAVVSGPTDTEVVGELPPPPSSPASMPSLPPAMLLQLGSEGSGAQAARRASAGGGSGGAGAGLHRSGSLQRLSAPWSSPPGPASQQQLHPAPQRMPSSVPLARSWGSLQRLASAGPDATQRLAPSGGSCGTLPQLSPAAATVGSSMAAGEGPEGVGEGGEPYRLRAVAHSLGGASLLMHLVLSCKQQRPHHISRLILLTPAGFHINIPKVLYILVWGIPMLVRVLRPFWPGFAAGLYLPTPVARLLTFKATLDLLRIPALGELARRLMRVLLGGDASQWDRALQMPHYNARSMPALSLHQGLHLIQWVRTRRFRLFDYGTPAANRRHYGTPTPPDLADSYGAIDVPVDIMAGVRDGIVPPENVRTHFRRMQAAGVAVTYKEFNYGHLDFTFAAKEELRRYVLSRLLRA